MFLFFYFEFTTKKLTRNYLTIVQSYKPLNFNKTKIMTESKLQQEIYQYYNNTFCLKHHSPRGVIFSVPNGGTRNKLEAITLKATGLLSGVSDLILIHTTGELFFIELKTEKGAQSDAQKDFAKRVEALGYKYLLIRSLEEFKSIICTS